MPIERWIDFKCFYHFSVPLNQTGLISWVVFFFFSNRDLWTDEMSLLPFISPSFKVYQNCFIPFVSFLSFQVWFPVPQPHNSLEESSGKINTKAVEIFLLLFRWRDFIHCFLAFCRVWQLQIIGLGSWLLYKPWRRCTVGNFLIWVHGIKCFRGHFLWSEATFFQFIRLQSVC